MQQKLATARRILIEQGMGGIFRKIYWYIERYLTSDHWWLGRLVELMGNQAWMNGCRFDLSSPVIGTPQKAGFLLGNYERDERTALGFIPRDVGLPIVEFGGSIGVMACVSQLYFGKPPTHVVVEANPAVIPVLKRNRDLNQGHFEVIVAALAYGASEISFHVHPKFVSSSLHALAGQTTEVVVPTINLQTLLEQHGIHGQIILFCDVEGAELDLVEHELDLLQSRVKYFGLEVHPHLTDSESVTEMLNQLQTAGFRQVYQRKHNFLFINERS
jgi:FkbM family methyltransferase